MSNRRKGQQQMDKFTQKKEQFSMLSNDVNGTLKSIINSVTVISRAIPMSITTRGVGFGTVIIYNQLLQNCNAVAKTEIPSIFTIYRVHLWLAYHKAYLAQKIQNESVSVPGLIETILIDKEKREELCTITVVPFAVNMFLRAIGKIKIGEIIFHLGFSKAPRSDPDLIKYQALVQTPENIRTTLDRLSTADTPLEIRQAFIELNPIPGARFENNLLMNADEIWPPEYSTNDLISDIRSYNSWMCRLPKRIWAKVDNSGYGDSRGLWSSKINRVKITSEFEPIRGSDGKISTYTYKRGSVSEVLTTWHSREKTDELSAKIGIPSMIGEECFLSTRYDSVASVTIPSFNSVQVMRMLVESLSWS